MTRRAAVQATTTVLVRAVVSSMHLCITVPVVTVSVPHAEQGAFGNDVVFAASLRETRYVQPAAPPTMRRCPFAIAIMGFARPATTARAAWLASIPRSVSTTARFAVAASPACAQPTADTCYAAFAILPARVDPTASNATRRTLRCRLSRLMIMVARYVLGAPPRIVRLTQSCLLAPTGFAGDAPKQCTGFRIHIAPSVIHRPIRGWTWRT